MPVFVPEFTGERAQGRGRCNRKSLSTSKLERQTERALDDARGVGGARNLAERSAGHADGGRGEQRMVAEIERVGAELQFHPLPVPKAG